MFAPDHSAQQLLRDDAPVTGPRINIAGFSFDPLAGEPPLPESLRAAPAIAGAGWWLVQLARLPMREEIARLKLRFAMTLTRRVPANTFLECIDVARVDSLRRESVVRAVMALHPAFKLARALREPAAPLTPVRKLALIVTPFPVANRLALLERLRAAGAEEVQDAGTRIHLAISNPAQLTALARMDEVRALEPVPTRAVSIRRR